MAAGVVGGCPLCTLLGGRSMIHSGLQLTACSFSSKVSYAEKLKRCGLLAELTRFHRKSVRMTRKADDIWAISAGLE